MSIYTALARPILSRFDSETIHDRAIRAARFGGMHASLRYLTTDGFQTVAAAVGPAHRLRHAAAAHVTV